MRLKINGSYNLDQLLKSDKRFISMVGGSRSGKTYAVLQYIIIYCLKNTDKTVTIARKTFPALRAGAYRELIQLLKDMDLYEESNHNKTNNTYTLHDNLIQFISIDQSIRLRGLSHDLVFVDEVNELSKEEFDQLAMRTTERIIMAQNPSDGLHFSLNYQNNPECTHIHSTFKDNPFLPQGIVNQILSYRETDPEMWSIYGEGKPAKNNELVYSNIKPYVDTDIYTEVDGKKITLYEDIIYGFDPGWNHPTALMRIYINYSQNKIWCEEVIHESYLTMEDVIAKMNQLGVHKDKTIYCDTAEPQRIESLRRAGFDATHSLKDVNEGIDLLKSMNFYLHTNSIRCWEETKRYKWKVVNEIKTDQPIKLFDDGLTAVRYAVYTYVNRTRKRDSYDFDVEIFDL